jgi:hypothetical protein
VEISGNLQALTALPHGNSCSYSLHRRLAGCNDVKRNLSLTGNRTPAIPTELSRFTPTNIRFTYIEGCFTSWDSAVDIAAGYGMDDRGIGVRVLVWVDYDLFTSFRPDLGSTQWVAGGSYPGLSCRGVKVTTYNWCRGQESVCLYIHSPIRLGLVYPWDLSGL